MQICKKAICMASPPRTDITLTEHPRRKLLPTNAKWVAATIDVIKDGKSSSHHYTQVSNFGVA